MQTNKIKLGKKFLSKVVLILVCFLSAYFITSIVVFPKSIKLIEGEKQYFNFKLPIKAIIEPETITVLKVNSKPVTQNVELNLYDNNEVLSEEAGSAHMVLNAFGVPVKNVTIDFLSNEETQIVPCGSTIGVEIKTDGVLVLGTGYMTTVEQKNLCPAEGKLKAGDVIIKVNEEEIFESKRLQEIIEDTEGEINLTVKRNNEILNISIEAEICKLDEKRKIGVHVRDTTKGIGTLTYYHPESKKFGALGHGIVDVDTKQIMDIKEGSIYKTKIGSVVKGKKGVPGELAGQIIKDEVIGEITQNSPLGIYGKIDEEDIFNFSDEKMKIGLQGEVHEGPAKIRSNVEGDTVEEFDIYIESVNKYTKDDSKGMVIKITDPNLLSKTSGIVQGMSGSPIIQDDKVIGAVTHVFVQDPTKGYGIFIENMLKQEK